MSIIRILFYFQNSSDFYFRILIKMKITTTTNRLRASRLESTFPQIRSFFTSGTTLLGANVMILGGFIALLLFNRGPDPVLNTEIIPPPSSPTETSRPTITYTPFPPSPLTPTPTASPTFFATPTPTFTVTATLPPMSSIKGISGHPQSMPLSCESRSAVDWAGYFGKSINEYTFFNGLPVHDNPDKGFVGSVYGSWGQIPPAPYGVHAKPVAQRLREFGLKAKYVQGMTMKELKAEIAAGQPVIVWVIGHVNYGTPVPYTASGGAKTTVARFEHTVIVIGYTENKLTVLDGARVYTRYKKEFLKSWDVLGNQAVIWLD